MASVEDKVKAVAADPALLKKLVRAQAVIRGAVTRQFLLEGKHHGVKPSAVAAARRRLYGGLPDGSGARKAGKASEEAMDPVTVVSEGGGRIHTLVAGVPAVSVKVRRKGAGGAHRRVVGAGRQAPERGKTKGGGKSLAYGANQAWAGMCSSWDEERRRFENKFGMGPQRLPDDDMDGPGSNIHHRFSSTSPNRPKWVYVDRSSDDYGSEDSFRMRASKWRHNQHSILEEERQRLRMYRTSLEEEQRHRLTDRQRQMMELDQKLTQIRAAQQHSELSALSEEFAARLFEENQQLQEQKEYLAELRKEAQWLGEWAEELKGLLRNLDVEAVADPSNQTMWLQRRADVLDQMTVVNDQLTENAHEIEHIKKLLKVKEVTKDEGWLQKQYEALAAEKDAFFQERRMERDRQTRAEETRRLQLAKEDYELFSRWKNIRSHAGTMSMGGSLPPLSHTLSPSYLRSGATHGIGLNMAFSALRSPWQASTAPQMQPPRPPSVLQPLLLDPNYRTRLTGDPRANPLSQSAPVGFSLDRPPISHGFFPLVGAPVRNNPYATTYHSQHLPPPPHSLPFAHPNVNNDPSVLRISPYYPKEGAGGRSSPPVAALSPAHRRAMREPVPDVESAPPSFSPTHG